MGRIVSDRHPDLCDPEVTALMRERLRLADEKAARGPAPPIEVWVVEKGYPYESNEVLGIFTSELKALRFIAAHAASGTGGAELTYGPMKLDPDPPKERSR